jgi:hypothetical protein
VRKLTADDEAAMKPNYERPRERYIRTSQN